jgi:hypothetical protein
VATELRLKAIQRLGIHAEHSRGRQITRLKAIYRISTGIYDNHISTN